MKAQKGSRVIVPLSLRALDECMSMEQWWNDTDRGKLKYWEKNIT